MIFYDQISLRPMTSGDLDMVRDWRNAKHVRKAMYTDHIVSPEEHRAWFSTQSASAQTEQMIAELDSTPIGVVAIIDINEKNKTCSWAFYIGSDESRVGAGGIMEMHALDRMVDKHGVRKISCEVLSNNAPVIKLHKKFGFEEEGIFKEHILKDGVFQDVVRLAIFADRWKEERIKFHSLFSRNGKNKK